MRLICSFPVLVGMASTLVQSQLIVPYVGGVEYPYPYGLDTLVTKYIRAKATASFGIVTVPTPITTSIDPLQNVNYATSLGVVDDLATQYDEQRGPPEAMPTCTES